MCSWGVLNDETESVLFQCGECGSLIRYVKEGYGEPHVAQVDGVFQAPSNIKDYLPCPLNQ